MDHWNEQSIKNAPTVNSFKSGLYNYKSDIIRRGIVDSGNFWEVSGQILDKIENDFYLENKEIHNMYLIKNPYIAKKKGFNLVGSQWHVKFFIVSMFVEFK